jgi:ribonuclease HI
MPKFYAVKVGAQPGIFNTWNECKKSIYKFSGAVYKSFTTEEEALGFILGEGQREEKTFISEDQQVFVYTDGACFGNPGPAGAAALLTLSSDTDCKASLETKYVKSLFLGKHLTNNIAELQGINLALDLIVSFLGDSSQNSLNKSFVIYSDSQYVINVLQGVWKAKQNLKLIGDIQTRMSLVEKQYNIHLNLKWVKGHAGHLYNEHVDKLAKASIVGANGGASSPTTPSYTHL